jgi:hypothetical protein
MVCIGTGQVRSGWGNIHAVYRISALCVESQYRPGTDRLLTEGLCACVVRFCVVPGV